MASVGDEIKNEESVENGMEAMDDNFTGDDIKPTKMEAAMDDNFTGDDADKPNSEETDAGDAKGELLSSTDRQASLRIRVENLPPFFSTLQVRKFLKNQLSGIEYCRLKTMPRVAIFSLTSEESVLKALEVLNGYTLKKLELAAKRVSDEIPMPQRSDSRRPDAKGGRVAADAVELVTPLAAIPYDQQLLRKFDHSREILQNLLKQVARAGIHDARRWQNCLKPVLPSPNTINYRNKCEFCIARATSGEEAGQICVGFVAGRMADREINIVKVDKCSNLTRNTVNIVHHFEEFVRNFDPRLDAFEEFKREGFWKMLTVRDFHGDCMLVVTAHPHPDTALVERAKSALIQKFIRFGNTRESMDFRVTSLYWQTIENASDAKVYEHLAGAPYIYETILGARFQISPSTFFQTNSRGAEILYTQIGDALQLARVEPDDEALVAVEAEIRDNEVEFVAERDEEANGHDVEANGEKSSNSSTAEESNANGTLDEADALKRQKTEVVENVVGEAKHTPPTSTVLLDICCGAGSISICLMKRMKSLARMKKLVGAFGCVGVELVAEAIRDANINAANNGFTAKNCRYFAGQAENIFHELDYHMPDGCAFKTANILGVLDPPRAGVHDKVIIGCRKLEQMKRLVYVSCDPRAATKNLTDLCRPTSNKYDGRPFRIVCIQPVDMFPQTEHFEWVVALERA